MSFQRNIPLVSIIIPVKDRFEWFKDCLQSVLDQNYPRIEIIVVDDHSALEVTDFIAGSFSMNDKSITVIRHEASLGPGLSREAGRQIAKGDYLCYLDSDDLMHPQKIWRQVETLDAHPTYGMCYCKSCVFSNLPLTGCEQEYRYIQDPGDDILPQLLFNRPWGTGACLWTKEATDLIGPWSSLRSGEDQEYEFRAGLLKIKTIQLPEVLFFIRRSNQYGQLNQNKPISQIEDAKMHLLISERIIQSNTQIDTATRCQISCRLFMSAVQMLSYEKKATALQCIHTLISIRSESFPITFLFRIIYFLIDRISSQLVYKLLYVARYKVLGLLKRL